MNRPFTGWHMTAILVAFFAVVVAVNVTMARDAISTFGGALAENGYVASQDYNGWIAAAAAQDRLGWTAKAEVVGGRLEIQTNAPASATAEVTLVHPLGRVAETNLDMRRSDRGPFRSAALVPPGRWEAHIVLRSGGSEAKFLQDVHG